LFTLVHRVTQREHQHHRHSRLALIKRICYPVYETHKPHTHTRDAIQQTCFIFVPNFAFELRSNRFHTRLNVRCLEIA